jgi:hypothetical protein
MHRASLLVACAVVLLCAPAAADDKDDCFNAAEKAQKLKTDKKLTLARPQLITCARDICPQQVRSDCVKWLGEVDGAMSTVVVRARDADGHDVIDVKVYVDDQLLLPKLQGTSTTVDPGQHKFKYEFPNGKSIEEDVLIAEGEKDRVIRVEMKEGMGGAAGGSSGGNVGGETKSSGPGPIPWIIGGVGLASLIGFAIMEIPIQSQYSDLKNGCGMTAMGCTSDQKSSVTSLYAPAGVLLGVGIVGLGIGATWLIISAVSHPANKTGSFGITPLIGGGFASYARSF